MAALIGVGTPTLRPSSTMYPFMNSISVRRPFSTSWPMEDFQSAPPPDGWNLESKLLEDFSVVSLRVCLSRYAPDWLYLVVLGERDLARFLADVDLYSAGLRH